MQNISGDDSRPANMGALGAGVAWLYRAIKERRAKTGAR